MATATKIADVAHKAVATGLILTTLFGLADVTRGFGVLVQRNIDRRNAPATPEAQTQATGAASREQ
jgi:hypothetical protein